MVNPLTVAGLAVGVVSLGIKVSENITTYIDALNYHDKDIASISQKNSSLVKFLGVIETSLSQFQHHHRVATMVVHECLVSCEKELNDLESLVNELTSCDQPTPSQRVKHKSKGKKLL